MTVLPLRAQQPSSTLDDYMIGQSPQMQRAYQTIEKVAHLNVPVIILGESGTGKELVAMAIHNKSRREGPFLALNCGALAESVLQNELFGHERGAYTDARSLHRGYFEEASDGTLFLDEILHMGSSMQSALLRTIQFHEFTRMGGTKPIKTNARVITAASGSIDDAVKDDKFDRPLMYRIRVIEIALPPLRERGDDIRLLAEHFCAKYYKEYDKPPLSIGDDALSFFMKYDWPGNVRELEVLMQRAVILKGDEVVERTVEGKHGVLTEDDFRELLQQVSSNGDRHAIASATQSVDTTGIGIDNTINHLAKQLYASMGGLSYHAVNEVSDRMKKDLAILAIQEAEGNLSAAARKLRVDRTTLYRTLEGSGWERTVKF